ncbi:MAG: hypothetical protein AAFT19_04425 [Pseudomonadota bacterium]
MVLLRGVNGDVKENPKNLSPERNALATEFTKTVQDAVNGNDDMNSGRPC